jgi:hypothetical protein
VDAWINLSALWQIVVVGLLCGAGLPAVFAVGVRALATPTRSERVSQEPLTRAYGGNPTGAVVASLCFMVVIAAIAWAIYLIVSGA